MSQYLIKKVYSYLNYEEECPNYNMCHNFIERFYTVSSKFREVSKHKKDGTPQNYYKLEIRRCHITIIPFSYNMTH